MKKVVHLINYEKFTNGYINYMKDNQSEYSHKFIVLKSTLNDYKLDENKDVYLVTNRKELKNKQFTNFFNEASIIIMSGIFFNVERNMLIWPKKWLQKTYLQFWGKDFYTYRNTKFLSKKYIKKKILHIAIKRCAGVLMLIKGEYEELCKIFPNKTKHFIVPVLGPKKNTDDKEIYYSNEKNILLGNSAASTNNHIEALEMLEHLKDNDFKIICPLSYAGEENYIKKVIKKGNEIFGDKFCPILGFMEKEEYFKILNTCQVAIFNNDRQQALGNINHLLKCRKKVYLKNDTSMWLDYNSSKLTLYSVNDLKNISFEDLFFIDKQKLNENFNIMKRREEINSKRWGDFFASQLN